MILSGPEIKRRVLLGNLLILPWRDKHLGPNSYDLTLHPELWTYSDEVLDPRKKPTAVSHRIPKEGFKLVPGTLYLGRTVEYTETPNELVPMIEGRSSAARLGIQIHVSAGFGDHGFKGYWTLEITVVHPVLIFPNMSICQIYYHQMIGNFQPYAGKYQNQKLELSRYWQEFDLEGTKSS